MSDIPKMVEIKRIQKETKNIRTFFLDTAINSAPGQFLMAWLPGIDEKPFGVSFKAPELGITVEQKGKFTEELFFLKEGDKIGIRGPYGNGFDTEGVKTACLVAGGVGVAPINALAIELKQKGVEVKIILGARSQDHLSLSESLLQCGELYITTDDGSMGEKGFTTNKLRALLKDEKFDKIYTCGPEVMMIEVMKIADSNGIEMEASLERYMRCGTGVCGACSINGIMVCKDGPVFNSGQLKKLTELGKWARSKSGKKVTLDDYCRGKC